MLQILQRGQEVSKQNWELLRVAVVDLQEYVFLGRLFLRGRGHWGASVGLRLPAIRRLLACSQGTCTAFSSCSSEALKEPWVEDVGPDEAAGHQMPADLLSKACSPALVGLLEWWLYTSVTAMQSQALLLLACNAAGWPAEAVIWSGHWSAPPNRAVHTAAALMHETPKEAPQ